jgi:predicted ATPase
MSSSTRPPFITDITLRGFLSFGLESSPLALAPLNVLIGPNGAGKSNLVEAFAVLRAVPRDLPLPIRTGGGVKEWLWRGESKANEATLELALSPGLIAQPRMSPALRYRLGFGAQGDSFVVLDERLENSEAQPGQLKPYFYFGYENGRAMLNVQGERRELRREDIDPTQSILSQLRDPHSYPEITALAAGLARILIYRNWSFGPDAAIRASCRADVRTDVLSENFDNLPARLAVLRRDREVKRRLLAHLSDLSPGFDDFEVVPEGGQLQLYVSEGAHSTPARRLSDGTLRFLSLLAILLDPTPPPVIVIEEPELGLHPDTLPVIRELLIEASARTQLIVTTHSLTLVDSFTEHPEAILVCDKVNGATQIARLDPVQIAEWRQHESLGPLWLSGQLGGTRW